MTTKVAKDERTQKEILFDRLFRVGEVGRGAIKKGKDISSILNGLQLVAEGKEVLSAPSAPVGEKPDWLEKILNAERQAHLNFFGKEFDLAEFEKVLREYGRKKVQFWKHLGLEPHFLPKVSMMAGDDYPGWKIKPEEWFYKTQLAGNLLRDINGELKKVITVELEGITVLIDTRLKPAYNNGKQMWLNDNLLGPIIKRLRQNEKISDYNPKDSRFCVSASEWEKEIRPALATKLGLKNNQIRLETTPERNSISQIYKHMPRKDDHNTNTSVWTEEFCEDRGNRLIGGSSGFGGLAGVRWDGSGGRWSRRSFRPLAVLN